MKNFCWIAACVFAFSTSQAQVMPRLGIKGGLNIASLTVNNSTANISSRLGVHAGLLAHIHLSKEIGLQPELVYSGQGMKQNLNGTTYEWNLGYINVPLMLQYMFNNGFRIEAGPEFGFLTSAKIKDATGSDDIKNDLKTTNVGLGFGLSYLSYSGLGIGGRYNLGLSNINNNGSNEIKNRVGQISVFYLFNHDHKAKSK